MRGSIRYLAIGYLAAVATACGGGGDDDGDSAGAAGATSAAGMASPSAGSSNAGSPSAGGAPSTSAGASPVAGAPSTNGGAPATAGSTSSAGTLSTEGGAAATAGSTSSAGTPSTSGGASATAGSTSSAGTLAGGTGGGTSAPVTKSYTFTADLETWKAQYTSSAAMVPIIPLAMVTVAHDPAVGDPMPGAMKISVPYAAASQYAGVGVTLAAPVDLTGKTITAKVQILSGLGTPLDLMTNPGGAKLYVKSGAAFVYASGTFTNLAAQGTWINIAFALATPSYVDMSNPMNVFSAADIREIGIQFDTSATTTTPMAAVLLVDTVSY